MVYVSIYAIMILTHSSLPLPLYFLLFNCIVCGFFKKNLYNIFDPFCFNFICNHKHYLHLLNHVHSCIYFVSHCVRGYFLRAMYIFSLLFSSYPYILRQIIIQRLHCCRSSKVQMDFNLFLNLNQ